MKLVKWSGHLFFIIYILFSCIYYLERTIPFDGALYCFKIVHFKTFNIENDRWGAFYTQLLPLILLKAGLSLKAFLLSYSLSFALWNYLFFLIITYAFRNIVLALGYILALILFYRYSFFYTVSEIHSTIGPLFLLFACIDHLLWLTTQDKKDKLYGFCLIVILLSFWIAKIHVIAMIPLGFYFVYLIVTRKPALRTAILFYVTIIVSLLLFFLIIKAIPKDSYQGQKMFGIDAVKTVFTDINAVNGYHFFKIDFLNNYSLNLLFMLAAFALLLFRKKFLLAAYLLIALAGYWVIIMAYNIKIDAPINYQNYYCYLGIIMALPIAGDLLLSMKRSFFIGCMLLLMSFNYYKLVKSGLKFQDRTEYIKRTTDNLRRNYTEKKFAVCQWNFDAETVWADWDMSFESLFISSVHSRDSSITFFTEPNIWMYDSVIHSKANCFVGIDWSPFWFSVSDINGPYFNLGKDVYRKGTLMQTLDFPDSVFTKDNLIIHVKEEYKMLRFEHRQIELIIENKSNVHFNSMVSHEKQLWLSYHLYDKNGQLITGEGDRTNIEVDIPPHKSIRTGLSLNLKNIVRGTYVLETDILHEHKRWFGINARTILTVY